MIATDVQRHLEALPPAFRLPLRALTAIDETLGRAAALDHALRSGDAATRFVALVLEDTKLALNLLRDLVDAQQSASPAKIRRIERRLDKALADAKARAELTPSIRRRRGPYRSRARMGRMLQLRMLHPRHQTSCDHRLIVC